MSRVFYHATAEQMVSAAEAVLVKGKADVTFVEGFCDLSNSQADHALNLAVDLGLLSVHGGTFRVDSPLMRFISTPKEDQKASVVRIVLESYEPFVVFRDRLASTNSAEIAAQQTKQILSLTAHREEIKDTLVSLGTYTSALHALGGGKYQRQDESVSSSLSLTTQACRDLSASEAFIRQQLKNSSNDVSRSDVLLPLASAFLKALESKPAEAVTEAGKAVESFLVELASKMSVSLSGANGITQKLEKFRSGAHPLPKKIVEAAKYLGHVRNAADHGRDIDPEVNAVWVIQESTGVQYVYITCSFILACLERQKDGQFIL